MSIAKPMLASKCKDISKLQYPLLVSPKLDGICCLVQGGKVLSRTFKDIPNHHIRETLQDLTAGLSVAFDGALTVGASFQACTSGIMSRDGQPDFCLHVFDAVGDHKDSPRIIRSDPFHQRLAYAEEMIDEIGDPRIVLVSHRWAHSERELLIYEADYLAAGYEGLMLRDPCGPYECGRSTGTKNMV